MVVTKTVDCAMQHSVCLLPEIDGALKEAGLALEDCDFFACAVGPGSFTGIRIGISTVKGLAFALGKPTLGVTSLRAIAYAEEGCRAALVDAGHGNVYAEGFGFSLPQGFYRAEEVVLRAKEAGRVFSRGKRSRSAASNTSIPRADWRAIATGTRRRRAGLPPYT